jgi:hypothetical protein
LQQEFRKRDPGAFVRLKIVEIFYSEQRPADRGVQCE